MSEQQFLWNSLDGGENVFIKEGGSDKIIHIKIIEGKHEFVDFMKKVNEQQATIERLEKENIELKKYKKYCAEWMGVKEENLSLRCVNMSDERFTTKGIIISNYRVWDTDDKPYANDDVVDLLNEMNEDIQYLNAFLVEQGLAEKYIRWKGDD